MSYNSLFGLGTHSEDANLEGWWKLQDDAANTTVVDSSGNANNATLVGGDNTADISGAALAPWLTGSINFDGSADYADLGVSSRSLLTGSSVVTVFFRANTTSTARMVPIGVYNGTSSWYLAIDFNRGSSLPQTDAVLVAMRQSSSSDQISGYVTGTNLSDGNDHSFAVVINPVSNAIAVYVDGVSKSVTYTQQTLGATVSTFIRNFFVGAQNNQGSYDAGYAGRLNDTGMVSRGWSASESVEWDLGPEPLNTVQPSTPSGTQTEGQTLTADTGTFDSQSNGTITYAYQWVRANDGAGSGAADIGSATSATYVLQAADVGKNIACRIAPSNDGGNDSAEDTTSTYTGTIIASGGGTTPKGVFGLPLHGPFGGPI